MSNGEVPPSKERLEYPPPESETGLTPGFLRVLHKQIGHLDVVNLTTLKAKWRGVCLPLKSLEEILQLADCTTPYIKWRTFLVEAAIYITPDSGNVSNTMQILIETMADRSEGVATNLSDDDFIELFKMVCDKKKVDNQRVKEAEEYFRQIGKRQSGVLTYENLKAHDCPKLS